ncbi:ankyrin repeat-containing domain protein [Russula ochroleuca]|jgi:ankyrin repeat protein|uniref:Ankyrin repeat-containing domain protein n=1 Tax=Russula ochroleuca TaxID=152965 RepID=A0A9P5MRR2_9AGAM|nr:ankyrin repeat-containing domain protein [Russula ochroleuca]
MAELLHLNGADLHCQGSAMMSPLHLEAKNSDVEVAQKLIEYSVNISAEDLHGCTPLHVASQCDHKDCSILQLLLEHGANVNTRRMDSSTPLHRASLLGAPEAVCLLLEHGADAKAEDENGVTALQATERFEKEEVEKLLREYNAK